MIHFVENGNDIQHWSRNFGAMYTMHMMNKLVSPYREIKTWMKTVDLDYAIVINNPHNELATFGEADSNAFREWMRVKPDPISSPILLPFEVNNILAANPHWVVGMQYSSLRFADQTHFMEASLLGLVG